MGEGGVAGAVPGRATACRTGARAVETRALLKARGAVEFGAAHYPLMVVLHASWLVDAGMAGPGPAHRASLVGGVHCPAGCARVGARQPGRALDDAGIGVARRAPVARGPYRWFRHPNYVMVVAEVAVVPLALGLPLVALIFSVANAAAGLANPGRKRGARLGDPRDALNGHYVPVALANRGPRR